MEGVGPYHHQRALIELFGVGEEDGVLVLICGLILGGLTFTAYCYCKVYDPLRLWCVKKRKECCVKKPKPPAQPKAEAPGTPEVRNAEKDPFAQSRGEHPVHRRSRTPRLCTHSCAIFGLRIVDTTCVIPTISSPVPPCWARVPPATLFGIL